MFKLLKVTKIGKDGKAEVTEYAKPELKHGSSTSSSTGTSGIKPRPQCGSVLRKYGPGGRVSPLDE